MWTRTLTVLPAFASFVAPRAFAKKKPPTQPINQTRPSRINCSRRPASVPVTAQKILQKRRPFGAFKSVNDLMAIRGIGPKLLEKMKMYLTVGKPKSANPAGAWQSVPGVQRKNRVRLQKPQRARKLNRLKLQPSSRRRNRRALRSKSRKSEAL